MSRRDFLKTSALSGAGALASDHVAPATALAGQEAAAANTASAEGAQKRPRTATSRPIRIRMGGYGPPTTGFSLALKRIGDQLTAKFGNDIDVKYVYNIMDLGYRGEDILWLVEDGVLTLGYQSSSYMTDRVPDLGMADLPFLFSDTAKARAAMDGRLGEVLTTEIEEHMNYRILGYFENGFRHVSNRVRPVRTPADLRGLVIRVLPSKVQVRTFELLGATSKIMDLLEPLYEGEGYLWVKPEVVIEISYQQLYVESARPVYRFEGGRYVKVGERKFVSLRPYKIKLREDKTVNPQDLRLDQVSYFVDRAESIQERWRKGTPQ